VNEDLITAAIDEEDNTSLAIDEGVEALLDEDDDDDDEDDEDKAEEDGDNMLLVLLLFLLLFDEGAFLGDNHLASRTPAACPT
jgi:hypothetical protein